MKAEDIEETPRGKIKNFLMNNKDEVFLVTKICEETGISDKTTVRYHLKKLIEDCEIERVKWKNKHLYGFEEAVKKVKEKLGR